MRTLFLFISIFILFVYMTSCINYLNQKERSLDFRFSRFEIDFFNMDSLNLDSSLSDLSKSYPLFFLGKNSLEINKNNYLHDNLSRMSYDSVIAEYPNTIKLEKELELLMLNYSFYFKIKKYEIFSYVSVFDLGNKIIATDSVAFVALDCYLGEDCSAYSVYPYYIREGLKKEFIVPDLAFELAKLHVQKNTNDLSYLQEMLYQGKLYYIASLLLPDQEKHNVIKYRKEQLEWCENNERSIWKYYIDKDLLFDTSAGLKSRFITEAPFSKFYLTIDQESPGRTGCWMGWQIIDSYMKHNDNSINELIKNTDAQSILTQSKYKP